jgi:hypothetical protein
MRVLPLVASLLFAGCLNGDFNSQDASVPTPDFGTPRMYDLSGVDLYGAYNCSGLNQCERACTTKACVFMCRNMASPAAVDKEIALQSCFTQYCPNDAGKVCAPDASGMLTMACMTCLTNTYLPAGQDCSPTQLPSECHQCLPQANACTADM